MITRSSKKINTSIVVLPDVDIDYNPIDNINEHRVLFKGYVKYAKGKLIMELSSHIYLSFVAGIAHIRHEKYS